MMIFSDMVSGLPSHQLDFNPIHTNTEPSIPVITQDNYNSKNVSIDNVEIEMNQQLDKIIDEADAPPDETINHAALDKEKVGLKKFKKKTASIVAFKFFLPPYLFISRVATGSKSNDLFFANWFPWVSVTPTSVIFVTKIVPSLWPKNTLLGESCF
jgi:hypothetical protein